MKYCSLSWTMIRQSKKIGLKFQLCKTLIGQSIATHGLIATDQLITVWEALQLLYHVSRLTGLQVLYWYSYILWELEIGADMWTDGADNCLYSSNNKYHAKLYNWTCFSLNSMNIGVVSYWTCQPNLPAHQIIQTTNVNDFAIRYILYGNVRWYPIDAL